MGTVVALAGQYGGAKLADGLSRLLGNKLTVIVNTGDDSEVFGLSLSPDIDTMLYTLAGISASPRGWEPSNETFQFMEMIKKLGAAASSPLGDSSLAMQVIRSFELREGRRLTEVVDHFRQGLNIASKVLPMSDDKVRTRLITDAGEMSYTDYFENMRCEPIIKDVFYAGAARAVISKEVTEALRAPDLEAIIICPCNPYHVIHPILAVNGMRRLLKSSGVPIVAVSPLCGMYAYKGSTQKMILELANSASSLSVATGYEGLIRGFVFEPEEAMIREELSTMGIDTLLTGINLNSIENRISLARSVLTFCSTISQGSLQAA